MRTGVGGKVRSLARQAMPFLVPVHRRYLEWSYGTRSSSRERLFTGIYRRNEWEDPASVSGGGSNLEQTAALRAALPGVLAALGVRTLLDAPCGDFHWMRRVDLRLERYIGGDIVSELVDRLQAAYGGPGRDFRRLDVTRDRLPRVDAILSRDCLVHFSYRQIAAAIRNFRASGATWLLTTTFTELTSNQDIVTGGWRALNLCAPPFRWPAPALVINEDCSQSGDMFADKSLGVWELASLPSESQP